MDAIKAEYTREVFNFFNQIGACNSRDDRIEIVINMFEYISKNYDVINTIAVLNKFMGAVYGRLDKFHTEGEQYLLYQIQIKNNFPYKTRCLHFTKNGTLCRHNQSAHGFCKQHLKIIEKNKVNMALTKKLVYKLNVNDDIAMKIVGLLKQDTVIYG